MATEDLETGNLPTLIIFVTSVWLLRGKVIGAHLLASFSQAPADIGLASSKSDLRFPLPRSFQKILPTEASMSFVNV
jgi:hypothetical protein